MIYRDDVLVPIGIAVEQDRGNLHVPAGLCDARVAVVGGRDDEAVDPPLRERMQDLDLALRPIVIAGKQGHVAGVEQLALRDVCEVDERW